MAADLDPALLAGHYALARDRDILPPAWPLRERDGWHLAADTRLPVHDLLDADGTPIGWALGHPIDLAAARMLVAGRVDARRDDPQLVERVLAWTAGLGGRFAIVLTHGVPTVAVDGFASLPVIVDPETGCVSSSPLLLRSADGTVPDARLVDELAVYRTHRYFPLGLTCHARARMVLPSHALDLRTMEARRVWPSAPLSTVDPATAARRIGELLTATMTALATTGPSLSLTAGGDSRMLLACARPVADRLRLFTVALPDLDGIVDTRVGRAIARRFGLDHTTLSWVEPTHEEVRRWMVRTGGLSGEYRGRRAVATYAKLPGGPYVSGVGPEVVRGRKWWPDDVDATAFSPADLLDRLSLPHTVETLAACGRWLEEVPSGMRPLDVLDLFFAEVIHGGWAAPMTFGYPEGTSTTIYPFGQQQILGLGLGIEPAERQRDTLRADVISATWPELLETPINQPLRRDRIRHRAIRLTLLPARLLRSRPRRSR